MRTGQPQPDGFLKYAAGAEGWLCLIWMGLLLDMNLHLWYAS
jgi:hypothetical protein